MSSAKRWERLTLAGRTVLDNEESGRHCECEEKVMILFEDRKEREEERKRREGRKSKSKVG